MSYSGSAATRLAVVQAAIERCLTSQEYYVGNRRQRMAELRDLRALEKDLIEEANAESQGSALATLSVIVGADQ